MLGILLYLDHADLCDIADGKAKDLADLQDAMDYAKAKLLVSFAHIIDLAGADSPTCERWLNAASMFGPVEFSIEPGNVTTSIRADLAEYIEAARPYFSSVRDVALRLEEASNVGVEAHKHSASPKPSKRLLRKTVDAVFENKKEAQLGIDAESLAKAGLDLTAIQAAANLLGLDADSMMMELTATLEDARVRGDLPKLVQLQRRADRKRVAKGSDTVDETHLRFALCADIFTVDGNVENSLQSIYGRPLPLPLGRDPARGEAVRAFEVGRLARVARALRELRDERAAAELETGSHSPP